MGAMGTRRLSNEQPSSLSPGRAMSPDAADERKKSSAGMAVRSATLVVQRSWAR
jgi:hypothetical protein